MSYKNALATLLLQTESSYRTAPSPAAKLIPMTSFDFDRAPNRQRNATISSRPLGNKTDAGDPTVDNGRFGSIFDLRSIGNWLKLLYGAATVGKAVTNQPTNVTGVTIQYAASDNTAGAGTLAWTASGTTLSWKTQGGTTGATQDVSAGGNFTLQSGGGNKSLVVTVEPALLPVGDASDTDIDVSATLKAHVFPFNLTDRPSALIEDGYSDAGKYYRTLGCKLKKLSLPDISANEQNISGELIGAIQTQESSVFDASPTSYAAVRACSGKGVISNGAGAGLGVITGGNIDTANEMTGIPAADGLEGYALIDQGDVMMSGKIRAVWDPSATAAYGLARAGTSTRMRFVSAGLSGAHIFQLIHDIPYVELVERRPAREGKSGIFADLDWTAHNGVLTPTIVLVNDVASY